VWLQPGAEDNSVIDFIEADAQFEMRCVYRARDRITQPIDGPPCIFTFV
jgi:hypothetical protein